MRAGIVTALLVLAASAAWAQEATSERALPPMDWEARPTQQDLIDHYPAEARTGGASGLVMMDCLVLRSLRLQCTVLSESPANMGFGAAAQALAPLYRARANANGQPTVGGRTLVHVLFRHSILEPPSPTSSSPTPVPIPVMVEPANLIRGPVWLAQPSAEQIAAAYPPESQLRGEVEVECTVGLHGLLHCNGVSVPNRMANAGFAEAARSLMQYYRIASTDIDAVPTVGRPVFVRIFFFPPSR